MKRGVLTAAALALAFVWGLGTATYEVFPYQLVRSVKNAIDGDDGTRDPNLYVGNRLTLPATSGDVLWGTRGDIVMVGDSITAYGRWDEMFPGRKIVNRGIGGDTIQGVKDRLPAVIAVRPRKAFLMVGVNDAFYRNPNSEILARYAAVLDDLKDAGVTVFVQSTLECGDNPVCTVETRDQIRALNRGLRHLADQRSMLFVDLNASMSGAGGLKPTYTWDGVHLNGEGYRVWRDILRPHIEPR